MVSIVDEKRSAIERLCELHRVKRLELFGSAACGTFDPRESDLDFVVEFEPLPPTQRAQSYFDLLAALQDLFARQVDLVELEAIDNPHFKRSLDATRQVLYAA
jgi:uncharacterized protein